MKTKGQTDTQTPRESSTPAKSQVWAQLIKKEGLVSLQGTLPCGAWGRYTWTELTFSGTHLMAGT